MKPSRSTAHTPDGVRRAVERAVQPLLGLRLARQVGEVVAAGGVHQPGGADLALRDVLDEHLDVRLRTVGPADHRAHDVHPQHGGVGAHQPHVDAHDVDLARDEPLAQPQHLAEVVGVDEVGQRAVRPAHVERRDQRGVADERGTVERHQPDPVRGLLERGPEVPVVQPAAGGQVGRPAVVAAGFAHPPLAVGAGEPGGELVEGGGEAGAADRFTEPSSTAASARRSVRLAASRSSGSVAPAAMPEVKSSVPIARPAVALNGSARTAVASLRSRVSSRPVSVGCASGAIAAQRTASRRNRSPLIRGIEACGGKKVGESAAPWIFIAFAHLPLARSRGSGAPQVWW